MSETNNIREFPEVASAGRALMIASQMGLEMGEAYYQSSISALQMALGDQFMVTEVGLDVKEGETLSPEGLAKAFSTTAQSYERLNNVRATIMWVLGDLCLIGEQMGLFDEVVAQCVSHFGQTKHGVQEAIRVCRYFPKEKRIKEWSYTHHREIAEAANRFEDNPEVLEGVIEEAAKGCEDVQVSRAGDIMTSTRPISCKDLRDRIKEACGHGDFSRKKKMRGRFLYFTDKGEVLRSDLLYPGVCGKSDVIVMDLKKNEVLGEGGLAVRKIGHPPPEWFTIERETDPPEIFDVIDGEYRA